MYYRCLLDDMLQSSRHFHLVATTCSLKALIYRIPLRLMIWRASCYTKSCHHHVIRPLTYLLALNPNTWSGNPCSLSILHENTQHCAFPMNHEWYLACIAFILFSITGATACGIWSISVSHLNRSVIREEKWYPG